MSVPFPKIGITLPRWDDDRGQLMQDCYDVFITKEKDILSFPQDYQARLLAAYRFLSVAFEDPYTIKCRLAPDTLDLI